MVRTGMKLPTDESLRLFIYRENELTVEQGCLMWGYRVIIPAKFQHAILKELHSSHLGATKMKAYARNYFWWPKMDKDIQDLDKAKSCDICCTMRGRTRLHMDYLGPINGRISVFVVCDSTSIWIEAKIVKSTTAQTAIEILSDMFARFELPRGISSDGARWFTGHEMTSFLKSHSIRHLVGAPFHPQTNGAGESAVKIVKTFLKKAISENASNQCLQLSLNKFLSQYRNTEHAATGDSPANMLLKRKARTLFDILLPSSNEQVSARQEEWIARGGRRSASFLTDQPVWGKGLPCLQANMGQGGNYGGPRSTNLSSGH
nr:uncharacterized protein K02A2.6-like [Halyomorpha halys]